MPFILVTLIQTYNNNDEIKESIRKQAISNFKVVQRKG